MCGIRRSKKILLNCALCFYLLVQLCHSAPQERVVGAVKHTAIGCLHNGTMFADTSIIPSLDSCLVCQCKNRNLNCIRRVCKDQPYPPPRGCILVHKKSLCCPYLSCSKYHINFYKNSERNHEHVNNYHQQFNHEKTLEKNSRTDDSDVESNGGCIESGSLYASGSAMFRSSASLCSYCYCINGNQKCIKPKCLLKDTKCKPIFMDASCCPIKYDCSYNSTASYSFEGASNNLKHSNMKRKNRSNGCFEVGKYYQEGEKLPSDEKRPCEMCYCIKGFRKCAIKKCAPTIRGCTPKLPKEGSCCPTSYDCGRSLKSKRESRQEQEDEAEADEPEDESDSIDFFSLLFGTDEPLEESTIKSNSIQSTTLPPFKALPSTEKSFFDLLRAGLEIIDANADKIEPQISSVTTSNPIVKSTLKTLENVTANIFKTSSKPNEVIKISTSTESLKKEEVEESSTTRITTTSKPSTVSEITSTQKTTALKVSSTAQPEVTSVKSSSKSDTTIKVMTTIPPTKSSSLKSTILSTLKIGTTKSQHMSTSSSVKMQTSTTEKPRESTTKLITKSTKLQTTVMPSTRLIHPSTEFYQRIPVTFNKDILPDRKVIENDDDEADAVPNLEIIPFVALDAIDKTDDFEPYRAPYSDNLEKDYFANDKHENKPFRYNNKFIQKHDYDDSADYVYTNPHERIDNGPYYYETNENQFDNPIDSFSPPNEQDILSGFSPKESIYDEVSTTASHELPLRINGPVQKLPLDPQTIHKHKSNLTLAEQTSTLPINQTSDAPKEYVIPDFKKISSNFTSFIDDLLHGNVLDEKSTTTVKLTTTTTTTLAPSTNNKPIKSIINDDDFILKHLSASTPVKTTKPQGVMEIFSKSTTPTMNGLLKLAGCNIYGQMYHVGAVIAELSNPCLECKCLPDIGVGCTAIRC